MFGIFVSGAVTFALNRVKEKFVNPNLDGIGQVREISYRDKMLLLTLVLEGLEDRPVEIRCSSIEIAPDGSSVRIGGFESNMPFAQNALNRFATEPFAVPEGSARMAVCAAKKLLGL